MFVRLACSIQLGMHFSCGPGLERIEIHHSPKHGSWFKFAEIELRVVSGNVLIGESRINRPSLMRLMLGRFDETQKAQVDRRMIADDASIKF